MIVAGVLVFMSSPSSANAEPERGADCAGPANSDAARAPDGEAAHGQATTCYNRAIAHEQAGRYDQAIAEFTLVIKLAPDFIDAFASRGVAYDQKGAYERAIADYTHAIDAADPASAPNPKLAEIYFNRGAAYEHRRFYRQAADDYRAALKLDTSLQPAKDGLKRLGGSP